MITIMDLCEIRMIIIGSIEGGVIEDKITTLVLVIKTKTYW